jgi:regulator of protease activity HflC (stomatin/prohibitin superfamily)
MKGFCEIYTFRRIIYMKKVIITENQKGFLFKNGKYIKLLEAGKYYLFGGREIIVSENAGFISCVKCPLDTLLADENVAKQTTVIEIGDEEFGLHFVNGKLNSTLRAGKYAFWNDFGEHTFKIADISTPYVSADIPEYVFGKLSTACYKKIEVAEYQKARLFIDNRFEKILDAGTYYFWVTNTKVHADFIDTRLTKMEITGQEILTADKVTLRINFVCNYRVTDYVKVLTEIDDYEEQMHTAAQLALREYIGKHKLDEILEMKEEISAFVLEKLKAKEKELFVEIKEAGVKDIILPGEIRDIMNTVLVAEKRAQANVITRREEVASTRSLLNTAKLMDENKTLYKLKELEYIERICENVGNINLNTGGDMLSQLAEILGGRK